MQRNSKGKVTDTQWIKADIQNKSQTNKTKMQTKTQTNKKANPEVSAMFQNYCICLVSYSKSHVPAAASWQPLLREVMGVLLLILGGQEKSYRLVTAH